MTTTHTILCSERLALPLLAALVDFHVQVQTLCFGLRDQLAVGFELVLGTLRITCIIE
jgi:hypothetical protein